MHSILPTHFAGLPVERPQRTPRLLAGDRQSVGSHVQMSWLEGEALGSALLDGSLLPNILIQEPGLQIQRRTEPIRRAIVVRINQRPFKTWDCRRIPDGTPMLVESHGPILPRECLT